MIFYQSIGFEGYEIVRVMLSYLRENVNRGNKENYIAVNGGILLRKGSEKMDKKNDAGRNRRQPANGL